MSTRKARLTAALEGWGPMLRVFAVVAALDVAAIGLVLLRYTVW